MLDAWNEIPAESIIKAFKRAGISNALDGSEDALADDSLDVEEEEKIEGEEQEGDERPLVLSLCVFAVRCSAAYPRSLLQR